MTTLESALLTVLDAILVDARRLRSEDLGFDIPVTAEAVGCYGFVSHVLSLRSDGDEITADGRVVILAKLQELRDNVATSNAILFDTFPEKVKMYEEELQKIVSL